MRRPPAGPRRDDGPSVRQGYSGFEKSGPSLRWAAGAAAPTRYSRMQAITPNSDLAKSDAETNGRSFSNLPLLMRPLGYERMKVGIVLQTLDTGAGKRLFGRFQMEQALHRNRHLLLFHLFREFLEFAGQRTGDSPSNATRNIS
jgi:hypothetical protein